MGPVRGVHPGRGFAAPGGTKREVGAGDIGAREDRGGIAGERRAIPPDGRANRSSGLFGRPSELSGIVCQSHV